MIVQIFYNGIAQAMGSIIDVAMGGTLMSKTEDEAYNLIEEMTLNHCQWSNEHGQPKRVGGKFDVEALTLLTAKMNAMTQKLDRLSVNAMNSCALSSTCDRCGLLDHETVNCQVGNPFAPSPGEHVTYMNNFQTRQNRGHYSNAYNPSWKHHLNFSYKTEHLPFPQANAGPIPPKFQRAPFP